jgi:hypothetical protein
MVRYFQLKHPKDKMILCDRLGCDAIADYLELEGDDSEDRLCAFHTMSDTFALHLPSRAPDPSLPYRSVRII